MKVYDSNRNEKGQFIKGHKINVGRFGKKHSKLARLKMSLGHKGKKWSKEKRLLLTGRPWSQARKLAEIKRKGYLRKPFTENGKIYSFNWHQKRKEIYQRDKWICQECGAKCHGNNNKDRIQCHHIDYNTTNCHFDNLITLCNSCHAKTNFKKKYWIRKYMIIINQKRKELTNDKIMAG